MNQLRPSYRIQLISDIGRAVQSAMKVADIPGYLAAFGVSAVIGEPVSSKWVLIRELLQHEPDDRLRAIAQDLQIPVESEASPSARDLSRILTEQDMQTCRDDFERALETVSTNPADAIGHACAALESICKAILHGRRMTLPKEESLKTLVKAVADQLQLSAEGHADAELKQLLGGLANASAGIAVIRTKYSAFHGKGPEQRRLVGRHARLAVNAASAVGLFLVETYLARQERENMSATVPT